MARSRPSTRRYKWEDFPVNRRPRRMRDKSPDDRDPKYRRRVRTRGEKYYGEDYNDHTGRPSSLRANPRKRGTSVKTAFKRKHGLGVRGTRAGARRNPFDRRHF